MKRAAAFFIAAVTILLLSLVVTGGKSILTAGIVAVLGGLAFAAFPAQGMGIIGFIVCAPVVAVQIAVGAPSIAVWLAVCGAVVFAPPAFGLVSFIGIRKGWGDPAAVLFLVLFITVWLAARKLHRNAITNTAKAMSEIIEPINKPIDEARIKTFKYFEEVGKWMIT
jgi:hypothetical protein